MSHSPDLIKQPSLYRADNRNCVVCRQCEKLREGGVCGDG